MTRIWRALWGGLLVVTLAACSTSSDGGGRGTGIIGATITGNIAATSTALDSGGPICPNLGSSAMVSVRGTGVAAPIEADCRFELVDVPPGDVVLDFEAAEGTTELALNNVPGNAVVTLTDVRLADGNTDVAAIEAEPNDASPVLNVAVGADPQKGIAPLTVQFEVRVSTALEPPVSWDFGDGSPSSSDVAPSHTYTHSGEFIVAVDVAVTNAETRRAFVAISVRDPDVVRPDLQVDLSARPTSGQAPLEVGFAAAVKNGVEPLRYRWNFGDESLVEGDAPEIVHTYERTGKFTAVVTVVDAARRESGDGVVIAVGRAITVDLATRTRRPSTATATPTETATSTASSTPTPSRPSNVDGRTPTIRPSALSTVPRTAVVATPKVTATAEPSAATVRPTGTANTLSTVRPTATARPDATQAATPSPTAKPTAEVTAEVRTATRVASATSTTGVDATRTPGPTDLQATATALATTVRDATRTPSSQVRPTAMSTLAPIATTTRPRATATRAKPSPTRAANATAIATRDPVRPVDGS